MPDSRTPRPDNQPVLLISGNAESECQFIEACLKTANIPYLKKDKETGGYMRVFMGYSVFGADYYVPARLHDNAKELLEAMLPDAAPATQPPEDDPEDESIEQAARRAHRVRTVVAILITAALLAPVLVGLAIAVARFFG